MLCWGELPVPEAGGTGTDEWTTGPVDAAGGVGVEAGGGTH